MSVEAQNAAWKAMTKAERRVAIAKDVILQIHADRLRAKEGHFLRPKSDRKADKILGKFDADKAVSPEDADMLSRNCTVCARGALMLSRVRLFNKTTWDDVCDAIPGWGVHAGRHNTVDALRGAFSVADLNAIECAFEKWRYTGLIEPPKNIKDCYEFGCEFDNADDRLLAIMQNIVDHGGDFTPSAQYKVVSK